MGSKFLDETGLQYLWGKIKTKITDLAPARPASTTDNAVVRFDGTTGSIQNSGVTIGDDNLVACPGRVNFAGGTRYYITSTGDASFGKVGVGSLERDSGSTYALQVGGKSYFSDRLNFNGTTHYIGSNAVAVLNQVTVRNYTGFIHTLSGGNVGGNPISFASNSDTSSAIDSNKKVKTNLDNTWIQIYTGVPYKEETHATSDPSSAVTATTYEGATKTYVRQFSYNSSTGVRGNREDYVFPSTPKDLAANASYNILTTKSAVTVAQGGTGRATLTSNAVLTGNGTSAINQVATASGAAYATAANGALTFGTLPAAQGGTGYTTLQATRNAMGLGNTTGALPVANGGTGTNTLTSGAALIGAGTGAVTTRSITNNTATTTALSGSTNLATANTVLYGICRHTGRTTLPSAADTNYTTYMFRGTQLRNTDTNPGIAGAICWTYE